MLVFSTRLKSIAANTCSFVNDAEEKNNIKTIVNATYKLCHS